MIRQLHNNDVVDCIDLVNRNVPLMGNYGYERNEAMWISGLITHITQAQSNANYFTAGNFDEDEYLKGFILCSTYNNTYDGAPVMDVRELQVDHERFTGHAFTTIRLYNAMMAHIKKHGGKHWRADSIRLDDDKSIAYCELLKKKYNGTLSYTVRGTIGD